MRLFKKASPVTFTLSINSFRDGQMTNETYYFRDEWVARNSFGIRCQDLKVFDAILSDSNHQVYGKLTRDRVT